MTASHITIRGLPESLAKALEAEKQSRKQSLNQTVIDLLAAALHLEAPTNGLEKFAGSWSAEEFDEFTTETEFLGAVDDELWA